MESIEDLQVLRMQSLFQMMFAPKLEGAGKKGDAGKKTPGKSPGKELFSRVIERDLKSINIKSRINLTQKNSSQKDLSEKNQGIKKQIDQLFQNLPLLMKGDKGVKKLKQQLLKIVEEQPEVISEEQFQQIFQQLEQLTTQFLEKGDELNLSPGQFLEEIASPAKISIETKNTPPEQLFQQHFERSTAGKSDQRLKKDRSKGILTLHDLRRGEREISQEQFLPQSVKGAIKGDLIVLKGKKLAPLIPRKNRVANGEQIIHTHASPEQIQPESPVLQQRTESTPATRSPYTPKIMEQFQESVRLIARSGQQRVDIQLNPQHLGILSIRMVQSGEKIELEVRVQQQETLNILRENQTQLRQIVETLQKEGGELDLSFSSFERSNGGDKEKKGQKNKKFVMIDQGNDGEDEQRHYAGMIEIVV